MIKGTILVVEDDKTVSNLVAQVLKQEGFGAIVADTAFKARGHLEKSGTNLSLVILDRRLPDADGVELCQEIRQNQALAGIPILFLTAKNTTADKVVGLKMGGDDYLVKPFSPEELVARVEAILRRTGRLETPTSLEGAGLKLELESRKAFLSVKRGGGAPQTAKAGGAAKEIALSPKEFDLLVVLLSRKNRVLTRQFLLQHVWGYDADVELSTRVVDVTFSHLRDKLGAWGEHITAVRGYGYRLDLD